MLLIQLKRSGFLCYLVALFFLLNTILLNTLGCGRGGTPDSTANHSGDSRNSSPNDPNGSPDNSGDSSAPDPVQEPDLGDDAKNQNPSGQDQKKSTDIQPGSLEDANWFVGVWVDRERKTTIYHGNGFVERKVGVEIQRQRYEATPQKNGEVLLQIKIGKNKNLFQILKKLDSNRMLATLWSPTQPFGAISSGQGIEWRRGFDKITKNGTTGPRVMRAEDPPNHLKIGDGVLVPAFAMKPWPPLDPVPVDDSIMRIEELEKPLFARIVLDPPAEGKPIESHFYFSQNGKLAVVTAKDGLGGDWWIAVWELTAKTPIGLFHVFNRHRPEIAISDIGSVVTAKIGNQVLVYDGKSIEPWIPPAVAEHIQFPAAVSSDGKRIAFHCDGGFQVWNTEERKLEAALSRDDLSAHNKRIDLAHHLGFESNGEILLVTSGQSATNPVAYSFVSSADWSQIEPFPRGTRAINGEIFHDQPTKQTIYRIKGNKVTAEERTLAAKRDHRANPLTSRFSLLGKVAFGSGGGWFLNDRVKGTSQKFPPKSGVGSPIVLSTNDRMVGFEYLDNVVEVWGLSNVESLFRFQVPKETCQLNGVPGSSHQAAGSKYVALKVEQGHAVLLSIEDAVIKSPAPTNEPEPKSTPQPEIAEWLWKAGKARKIPKVSTRTAKREDYLTVAAVRLDEFSELNARARRAYREQQTGSETLDAIKKVGELLPTNEKLELLNMAATLAAFEFAENSKFKQELHNTNRYLEQRGFDKITEKEEATLKLLAKQENWPATRTSDQPKQ